jgi:predicted DCC family thiol-disulfide oxidoreductase YuxK
MCGVRAWVLYDGNCRLCLGAAHHFEPWLKRYHFCLVPLQTPWVRQRLGLRADDELREMALLTEEGRVFGGGEAILQIVRRVWWAWPFFLLAHLPGVRTLLRAVYHIIASRRHCFNGVCQAPTRNRLHDWLPLILLPVATLLVRDAIPAWVLMWAMGAALFFGCKWLTWRRAIRRIGRVSKLASFGYLLAWVGMDALRFLAGERVIRQPRVRDWLPPIFKILVGGVLVAIAMQVLPDANPLVAGWLGMFGLILCLHFGTFELLALSWQRAGFKAQPIMNKPLRATSLAEFWGRRWNAGFHQLAHDLVFRPLLRRCGAAGAMLAVFFVSGLVHELMLSFPARGGYGLPLAYFLIQGLGVLVERTPWARRLGLGGGWRGWLFTLICAAGPVFWLFHPAFIHNVILPMLKAIGTT